jgi:hypothetical protein
MRQQVSGIFCLILGLSLVVSGCSSTRADGDYDPKNIEARYGLTGAYTDKISTEEGTVDATIVPTTLSDGRRVQLVIPHHQLEDGHQVYMRDGVTITPVALADPGVQRRDFVQTQQVVERRVAPATSTTRTTTPATTKKKRSTKDEILIVGGSAGAGAAIGAVAGGGKGAAIGAMSGGIAGLVYDLATKNK